MILEIYILLLCNYLIVVAFEMVAENTITDVGNNEFCNTFGIKTTRDDIISLVNEQFPKASQFTGATQAKSLTSKWSINI